MRLAVNPVPSIHRTCARHDKTTNPATMAMKTLTIFLPAQASALTTFGSGVVETVVVVVVVVVVVGGNNVNGIVDVVDVVVKTSISLPISKIQSRP